MKEFRLPLNPTLHVQTPQLAICLQARQVYLWDHLKSDNSADEDGRAETICMQLPTAVVATDEPACTGAARQRPGKPAPACHRPKTQTGSISKAGRSATDLARCTAEAPHSMAGIRAMHRCCNHASFEHDCASRASSAESCRQGTDRPSMAAQPMYHSLRAGLSRVPDLRLQGMRARQRRHKSLIGSRVDWAGHECGLNLRLRGMVAVLGRGWLSGLSSWGYGGCRGSPVRYPAAPRSLLGPPASTKSYADC